jgi:hypothetical protein
MVRRWVAISAIAVVVVLAGCSSDGGSSASSDFHLPKLAGKDWTPAGLATAKATTDAIARALPGQCAEANVADFSQIGFGMEQVRSRIIPTAQTTCDVNDESVEITVFADQHDRDRFVDDRSTGLCRIAAAQQKKYKARATFPGIRWVVGAGNITLQPDSESVARRLAAITGGSFVPRPCDNGVHADWNATAIKALDALGKKVAAAGHGCDFVDLVGRETLPSTQTLGDRQLPVAIGNCSFDTATIQLITWVRSTPQVRKFVADRVKVGCSVDPALGRIDGDTYAVLAPGTIAEQVQPVVGGKLAARSCG